MKRMFRTCALLAALLLAAAALAGCAAQDERVAARVGDREITMQLFKNAYLNSLTYASIYYDLTTDEGVEAYQDDVINSLIQTEMLLYQAEQAGVTLSEEEEAEAVADGQADYDSFYDSFLEQAEQAGATDVRAYANKLLTDTLVSNGMTVSEAKQSYIDSARNNMIIEKMQNRIFAEVEPTEEELYDMYEEELQVQKDLFDESPASYFTYDLYAAYGNNCIPLYIPEGFIRVRQILVEDEETANELLTRLMEGEDFEALLNQYNTDPGMADEANADGYLVGEGANYLEEFLEAALALENDGDISPVVETTSGFHIIKRLRAERSREIAYDEEKETLDEYFTSLAKSEHYTEVMDAWMADESLVTRYEELYRTVR